MGATPDKSLTIKFSDPDAVDEDGNLRRTKDILDGRATDFKDGLIIDVDRNTGKVTEIDNDEY